MQTSKTYWVGASGTAYRLDNFTLPWVNVSVANTFPDAAKLPLYDVETDPVDSNKVFAVGMGNPSDSIFGVYVSTDGGATWYVPGGNYQTNQFSSTQITWYEVHVQDSQNIMISGQNGYIAISTDGGLTFNLSTQMPLLAEGGLAPSYPTCYSLHFISPLIGVVGTRRHVLITYDAGITWLVLNLGNPIASTLGQFAFEIRGIHLSADQQTIVALSSNFIFTSTNAGNSFVDTESFLGEFGLHLTWTSDLILWGFGAKDMVFQSIDGGSNWNVIQPFSALGLPHYAGHFYNNTQGFFSENNELFSTTDAALTGTSSWSGNIRINAVWTIQEPVVCFLLEDCEDKLPDITTDTDLSLYVGQVIKIEGYTACWTVSETQNCDTTVPVTLSGTPYQDCTACLSVPCYLLTDCANPQNTIEVTNPEFAGYLNQVVQICNDAGCSCYTITANGVCLPDILIYTSITCFDNCESCLPQPTPPVELIKRTVKPGYNTPGCPPAYTEKINCTFGEQVWDEVVAVRYGVKICCDHDVDKWDIKKQILDLKALYDPALDIPITPVCKCYTISQYAGSATYKYVNCAGSLTEIISTPNTDYYICAQSFPKVYCLSEGGAFEIINSDTTCTDNAGCIPTVCYCYEVLNINRVPITIDYVSCETGLPSQYQLDAGGTFYVCAEEGTVTGGIVSTASVPCTTTESCQPPIVNCYCYTISNKTIGLTADVTWKTCDGSFAGQTLPYGDTIVICAEENSVNPDGADVTGGTIDCSVTPCIQ